MENNNELMEEATQTKGRTCRVCGCTEDNCIQCIEKTGRPCHWVEDDLCSACYVAIESTVNEVNAELTEWSNDPANFFQQLYPLIDGIDITMKVKRKNGRLTISVLPETTSVISPAILTGTPEELDNGFFAAVSAPISDAKGLKVDLENYKKSIEKSKEKPKTETEKAKAEVSSKPTAGKKQKEKPKAKKEEPKISAPNLFATV
jgi:PRTRC genetic system protein E